MELKKINAPMIIKSWSRTKRKLKNQNHQDQDKLREAREEMEEQAGEQLQQEQEELFGTQGTMEDGAQDQGTELTGQQDQDPDQMEGATSQGKERRRRMMQGWG